MILLVPSSVTAIIPGLGSFNGLSLHRVTTPTNQNLNCASKLTSRIRQSPASHFDSRGSMVCNVGILPLVYFIGDSPQYLLEAFVSNFEMIRLPPGVKQQRVGLLQFSSMRLKKCVAQHGQRRLTLFT